jgi:2-C-methyl-D-erythritol 4-phosphate cytidylyltransferase
MTAQAILVAAGAGMRLGERDGIPKALRPLNGVPMYVHALRVLSTVSAVKGTVVVVSPGWEEYAMGSAFEQRAPLELVAGGATRQASVAAGLRVLGAGVERVVVHDAARPLVDAALIERVLAALDHADGAVCAVPLTDTLKRVRDDRVVETFDREGLWRVQTPQAFRLEILRRAHDQAARDGVTATDDAALVERAGGSVVVVPGDERNVKVTTATDFALAEALLDTDDVRDAKARAGKGDAQTRHAEEHTGARDAETSS